MKTSDLLWVGGGLLFVYLLAGSLKDRLFNILWVFIPMIERFEPHPYWDVSRYSWGYGTAAPGATGTISRKQAFEDMTAHLLNDYNILKTKVTRTLTAYNWASLLSFAYNAGIGAALKLVDEINAGETLSLFNHMREYKYAGGQVNQTLIDRREKEIRLWQGIL